MSAAAITQPYKDIVPVISEPPSFWKGISFDVLVAAGVEVYADGTVRIPYFNSDGSLYAWRTFLPGEQGGWRWPFGTTATPYGLEQIPHGIRETDIAIVTEGESDTLAIREHFASIDDRRVFAIGIPGAGMWKATWVEFFTDFPAVYITFDGDTVGRKGAEAVKRSVRWARVVRLPEGEDVRGLVQREGAEKLLPLMEAATFDLKVDIGFRRCRTLEEMQGSLTEEIR